VKRRLIVILGLSLMAAAAAQDTKPPAAPPASPKRESETSPSAPAEWPGVKYAEVRAYLYNPPKSHNNRILRNGELHPEVVNPDGIKLDAGQVKQLLKAIQHREPDRRGGCFYPHHGIVFHDREGKAVASLSICFVCASASESPHGPDTMKWDLSALDKLVRDLGLPVFKDMEEADAHFIALARQWPDAKVKEKLEQYLFRESKPVPEDDMVRLERMAEEQALSEILQGMGERIHPFLLSCLADKRLLGDDKSTDQARQDSASRFHRLCDLFGDSPPPTAVPLLTPFFESKDASVRGDAALTIAKAGVPGIVPVVRKALADPTGDVSLSALAGLQEAMDRGILHVDAKAQLFPDVKALDGGIDDTDWAKALLGLNADKALEFFLGPEIFKADSPRLAKVLETLCEINQQLPRKRLLTLVSELRAAGLDREREQIMKPALILLGRQRHPDDLELLRGMGDNNLASAAMPGLLAWHGLEGYRERLSKKEEEKGFAALNEAQRLHFAASEFEMVWRGIDDYFSRSGGDHWRDALAGLKAMKRDKLVAILEECVAKFGEEGPAREEATRKKQVEALVAQHAFDDLYRRLQKAVNRWDLSLDRFAIEHADSFK
jgi:hypothetical protein